MNILFLTLVDINNLDSKGGYPDLLREFVKNGHNLFIVKPSERRHKKKTQLIQRNDYTILSVKTFNIQKANIVEKGIGTIAIEYQFLNAIRRYFKKVNFDLVLYSTPPITFGKVIKEVKKRHKASSYLLLKDIFPQNAVDLGMFSKNSLIYRYFKNKEKELYNISDYIGCMSPANVQYVLMHNDIDNNKVELCPNAIEVSVSQNEVDKEKILKQYSLPLEGKIFIYGGNLGKPQGLNFLLKILETNKNKKDRYFLIVGSGTEFNKIESWFSIHQPFNAKLIQQLPQLDYENLVSVSDVGLIFLDHRFTIPNYPSRLLSYLEKKIPVLMATDKNTDIGYIAEENNYGKWCENGDIKYFNKVLNKFCDGTFNIKEMGENGYVYLNENYTVDIIYNIIMKHF